jgi:hypothetical protein
MQLPLLHSQVPLLQDEQLLPSSLGCVQVPAPSHTSSVQGLESAQAGGVVSKPLTPMFLQ